MSKLSAQTSRCCSRFHQVLVLPVREEVVQDPLERQEEEEGHHFDPPPPERQGALSGGGGGGGGGGSHLWCHPSPLTSWRRLALLLQVVLVFSDLLLHRVLSCGKGKGGGGGGENMFGVGRALCTITWSIVLESTVVVNS